VYTVHTTIPLHAHTHIYTFMLAYMHVHMYECIPVYAYLCRRVIERMRRSVEGAAEEVSVARAHRDAAKLEYEAACNVSQLVCVLRVSVCALCKYIYRYIYIYICVCVCVLCVSVCALCEYIPVYIYICMCVCVCVVCVICVALVYEYDMDYGSNIMKCVLCLCVCMKMRAR